MKKRPTFERACAQYVHRFTVDHAPAWSQVQRDDGTYYAPQFASDREWYDNTLFPGEHGHYGGRKHCYARNQTWPRGQHLLTPYRSTAR